MCGAFVVPAQAGTQRAAPLPAAPPSSYTTPMSNDNEQSKDAQDRERIERLENLFLEMAQDRQALIASALKHDMMLEMLQAVQRDHTRDIQEHKETQQQIVEMLKDIIDIQQTQAAVQQTQAEIQRDHDIAIKEQKETQEAMRVAIQTLSTILRRLTENGNSSR